jgi:hypothetical protein
MARLRTRCTLLQRTSLGAAILLIAASYAGGEVPPQSAGSSAAVTAPDTRGTDQNPLTVRVTQLPPKSPSDLRGADQDSALRQANDRRMYWLGIWTTAIAGITAVILAFQLSVFGLQARRLRESVDESRRIAAASEASAHRQAELTKAIERRKIRPLLKIEWFPYGPEALGSYFNYELRMRNVGLGAAIVDRFELMSRQQLIGEMTRDDQAARVLWQTAVRHLLGPVGVHTGTVSTQPLSDLTRALAPSEYQWIARIEFTDSDQASRAYGAILSDFELIAHFRSLAGECFSTRTQFSFEEL